jgi:hypothetical protein
LTAIKRARQKEQETGKRQANPEACRDGASGYSGNQAAEDRTKQDLEDSED